MNCPHCGARMTDGARWCGLCLQAVPAQAVPGAVHEVAASTVAYPPQQANDGREYLQARSAAEHAWSTMTGEQARSWSQGEPLHPGHVSSWLGGDGAPQVPVAVPAGETTAQGMPSALPATGASRYAVAYETGALAGEHRMVHLTSGERGWVCRMCDSSQPLTVATCPACGTSLFSSVAEKPSVPKGDAAKALLWSIIPGGGQWYLGLRLQAVARASLVALTFMATISFPGQGGLGALRLAMGITSALLWGVSALDARSVAVSGPRSALLDDRRLMWVSMGVIGLLAAAVVLAFLMGSMSGSGPPAGG